MSSAVEMFLRQVVLQRGIPFEMKLPERFPIYTEEPWKSLEMRWLPTLEGQAGRRLLAAGLKTK
jgi:antitoxin component of RelBE/YafQ-DinJ toxin-antitoxin module